MATNGKYRDFHPKGGKVICPKVGQSRAYSVIRERNFTLANERQISFVMPLK